MRGWGFRRRNFQMKHNNPNLAYTLLAVRSFPTKYLKMKQIKAIVGHRV